MNTESREFVRKAYSISGEEYDNYRQGTRRGSLLSNHDIAIFKRLFPEYRQGMQVLEVGAGTGRFTLPALRKGYRLLATDINQVMLDTLQDKLHRQGLADRCDVRVESIFRLSFPDDHFDFVFCLHVIPRFLNVDDQRSALIELSRVVKPGGILLFNYRNARSPYNLLYKGHAIAPSQLGSILDDAGMRIAQQRVKHVLNRSMLDRLPVSCGKALSVFDRAFERFLPGLGWDVFLTAVKQNNSTT